MRATVIAERMQQWRHSMTVLRDSVAELPPVSVPPDRASALVSPWRARTVRLWQPTWRSRDFGQSDKFWVVAGVAGHSRFIGGWMIPSRQVHDVLDGHLECCASSGPCPAGPCATRRPATGRWRWREMAFTAEFHRFRGGLGRSLVPDS